jgi:hypothetical protein
MILIAPAPVERVTSIERIDDDDGYQISARHARMLANGPRTMCTEFALSVGAGSRRVHVTKCCVVQPRFGANLQQTLILRA